MTIYSVSDAYKTAIRARTRTDRVTGTLTLTNGTVLNLDAADLMSGSLTLDNQCVTGEELAFGCAYLGQAAFNLRTDLSRYAFYGAKLVLHYGLQLPGGRWETVPLGVYTVAEAERRALYVSIKAYDNILALQQKYDGTTMQGTAYALLGQIAAACGLTLGQTEAEIGALNPNAALVCQLSGADGLSTWRECAAAVAQLVGGFAAADRAGLPMEDGTAPEMLVTHFVWRYRGRQTLKGVGRNPYLGGTTDGATEKALRRLQNSAESKRIVYYSFTNPAELAVQTVETPAVAIAFTAVEETSAMFLAQLLLDAAPDTGKVLTLTVRYYINDVPVENFAPQQRLETGAHTLALFYPFASVEAGTVTRLSVRLVCAGGTVKIAPYGIKATVTGQGMASETPWDGTLECEETLLPIAIKARSINV